MHDHDQPRDQRPQPVWHSEEVSESLRRQGLVSDEDFDAHLPASLRNASRQFWTPILVAGIVVRMLVETGAQRVLDVGAGCGKLCIVGALASGLSFTGLEHRPSLVLTACKLAHRFAVDDRVFFRYGGLDRVDFEEFDAIYLYNPFAENAFASDERLDATVELSNERFHRDVVHMEETLGRMAPGKRLVTYHGFGGRIPGTYELSCSARAGTGVVRMWTKTANESSGMYWLETEDVSWFRETFPDGQGSSFANRTARMVVNDDRGAIAMKVATTV